MDDRWLVTIDDNKNNILSSSSVIHHAPCLQASLLTMSNYQSSIIQPSNVDDSKQQSYPLSSPMLAVSPLPTHPSAIISHSIQPSVIHHPPYAVVTSYQIPVIHIKSNLTQHPHQSSIIHTHSHIISNYQSSIIRYRQQEQEQAYPSILASHHLQSPYPSAIIHHPSSSQPISMTTRAITHPSLILPISNDHHP